MSKFKEGDTILLRGKINSEVSNTRIVHVVLDGEKQRKTGVFPDELIHAVKYDPDLPLPGQEVWGSDNGKKWSENPCVFKNYEKDDIYPFKVDGGHGLYKYITTENPHTKKETEKTFTLEDLKKCFDEARKTNAMVGFKYDTFEELLENMNKKGK